MNNLKFAFNYGLAVAIVGIIGLYLQNMVEPGSVYASIISILVILLMVFIIYSGIINYFSQTGKKIQLSDSIKISLIISLIGGLIYGIFSYIYYEFISPSTKEKLVKYALEQSKLSGEELEKAKEFMENFYGYSTFAGAIVTVAFIGLITGIIIGLWKKEE